jgi:hypothetical protein
MESWQAARTEGAWPQSGGVNMRKTLKFYLNLALVSFTVGRAFGAFRQRLARDVARRRAWN